MEPACFPEDLLLFCILVYDSATRLLIVVTLHLHKQTNVYWILREHQKIISHFITVYVSEVQKEVDSLPAYKGSLEKNYFPCIGFTFHPSSASPRKGEKKDRQIVVSFGQSIAAYRVDALLLANVDVWIAVVHSTSSCLSHCLCFHRNLISVQSSFFCAFPTADSCSLRYAHKLHWL